MIPSDPAWLLDVNSLVLFMESTIVFIDGAYLAKVSKHFGNGKYLKIDYNQFAMTLAKDSNFQCSKVFFYDAPPYQDPNPTPDQNRRKAGYDKLINKLRKAPNFIVREGRCQKIDNKYKQKGVDTLITMDLMEVPNNIKTIILFTSDTDFVPVIKEIRNRKKLMLYCIITAIVKEIQIFQCQTI